MQPEEMQPKEQPYMGLAEVATYLTVSKQTVLNWRVRCREFPAPVADLQNGAGLDHRRRREVQGG
jgi:hypothetical protein